MNVVNIKNDTIVVVTSGV